MSAAILRGVSDADIDALKYFHVTEGRIAGQRVEISRTGFTGDLGYEIWVDAAGVCAVWDALIRASATFALKPAGLLALDVARIEAGLLSIDVDFFSVRKALTASRWYTPFEMGLGRLVDFGKERFIGRAALAAERTRGPRRRIVGVTIDWNDIEALYASFDLPPIGEAAASRLAVPVFRRGRQVGRMTSSTWSPVLKQMIGLATIDTECAASGTRLEIEHSVDAVHRRVGAVVTARPFFNPPRKTTTPRK
jgi:aminomethyltransferase